MRSRRDLAALAAARYRSKSSASPKCAATSRHRPRQLGADRLAVLEPGEREPLRLRLELGLLALARHEGNQQHAQEARIVVFPGLRREPERASPLSVRLREEARVLRQQAVRHQVVANVSGGAQRRRDDVAVGIGGEARNQRKGIRHRDRAGLSQRVRVADQPDALGWRKLRVGDREQLRREGRPCRSSGSSRALRRSRTASPRRRRPERESPLAVSPAARRLAPPLAPTPAREQTGTFQVCAVEPVDPTGSRRFWVRATASRRPPRSRARRR